MPLHDLLDGRDLRSIPLAEVRAEVIVSCKQKSDWRWRKGMVINRCEHHAGDTRIKWSSYSNQHRHLRHVLNLGNVPLAEVRVELRSVAKSCTKGLIERTR